MVKPPEDPAAFDVFDPANVSPLVAALAAEDCPVTGQVYFTQGGLAQRLEGWRTADELVNEQRRPTITELSQALGGKVTV
jgi:hypothetical protein